MGVTDIINLALALLPVVETEVPKFINWIEAMVSVAKTTGEWTPEQDAAFKTALFAKTKDPAYQPDP